jgi:recombination protein RecA
MAAQQQRRQQLDAMAASLQMQYGPRALRRAALPAGAPAVPHLSTSFADLDRVLEIGGLPRGRISEICGPATSGKATLAARVLAAAQQEEGEAMAAWVDVSSACDPEYLRQGCGLDLERLLIVRPASGADALAITLHLTGSNTLAALVFDGLADLEAGTEGALAGTLERLVTVVTETETALLFLSEPQAQHRTLAHVASVRLGIQRRQWISEGQDVRGYESQVEVLKNRFGRPGATVPVRIMLPI